MNRVAAGEGGSAETEQIESRAQKSRIENCIRGIESKPKAGGNRTRAGEEKNSNHHHGSAMVNSKTNREHEQRKGNSTEPKGE